MNINLGISAKMSNMVPSASPQMTPRRIVRNVIAERPSPVATPNVFIRNESQQQKAEEVAAHVSTSASNAEPPNTSSRRSSITRDSGIFGRDSGLFGSSARTPRSLLRHALPGLPTTFPTPPSPPTPALSSPSVAIPSPMAGNLNLSSSSYRSPLPLPPRFTKPFTSPSPAAFDHLLPFTPPASTLPIKRGPGRPPRSAAAVAPSSASKSSSQNISIVGGCTSAAPTSTSAPSASTPATASKSSRRELNGALPRHVTKELFLSQCRNISVDSSAVGELLMAVAMQFTAL
jgi:hypothetical protein